MTQNDNLILNALVGAIVSVILSFLPFSPVLGGGVAGYLEKDNGIKVGALSGCIALLPLLFLFMLIYSVVFFGLLGMTNPVSVFLGGLFWIVFVLFSLFTIGLSALGGLIGEYLTTRNQPTH